jgi:hypothetical protein
MTDFKASGWSKSCARRLIVDLTFGLQQLQETAHVSHSQTFAVVFNGRKFPRQALSAIGDFN